MASGREQRQALPTGKAKAVMPARKNRRPESRQRIWPTKRAIKPKPVDRATMPAPSRVNVMAHEQANSPRSKAVTPAPSQVPVAVMRSARNRLINRRHAIFNVRIPKRSTLMTAASNRHNRLSSVSPRSRLWRRRRNANRQQPSKQRSSGGGGTAAVPCRVPADGGSDRAASQRGKQSSGGSSQQKSRR